MSDHEQVVGERQVVVFSVGEEEFGVNINEVREIHRMEQVTHIPNTAPYVRGVINLRGSIIVVVDLAMRLGLASKEADKNTRIIVIEVNDSTVGMIVDSATEVLRLSSEQVRPPPGVITERIDANYIEGVGVVGERLLILLDLAKVLGEQELASVESVASSVNTASSSQKKADEEVSPKEDSSDKSHPSLDDVHHEYHFISHEGKPIKNVHELLTYVKDLDKETFGEFVNEEKNDFYNWIKYVVKDDKLADQIQHVTSKKDVTKELRDRILHVKLKE
jgi:purine-binding chemotaxis protein CheW